MHDPYEHSLASRRTPNEHTHAELKLIPVADLGEGPGGGGGGCMRNKHKKT